MKKPDFNVVQEAYDIVNRAVPVNYELLQILIAESGTLSFQWRNIDTGYVFTFGFSEDVLKTDDLHGMLTISVQHALRCEARSLVK